MAHTSTTAGSAHTSDTPAPTRTLEADSMQQKHRAGSAALTELLRPIRGQILLGRILAALSGLLAIAPYIALVQLGNVLITARAHNLLDGDLEAMRTIVAKHFPPQLYAPRTRARRRTVVGAGKAC